MNCSKCEIEFKPYFLKNGMCRGCLHPELIVKAEVVKPTRTVFRKYPEGDIIALFPDEEDSPGMILSYQHLGQHSGADYLGVMSETVPADPKEYESLKRELERIGYNVTPLKKFVRRRR